MPALEFGEFCELRYCVIGKRYHCRTGSIGISVKKNNVLLALSPGLLHGLYKDWDESIENKETKGVWGGERNQQHS